MKKRALFVGVDEYADGSIARLEHAVDDSEALAAVFETLLGFERVERLRNPGGKQDILNKVREVTSGLGTGDLFFFFFAGHGFRVKENHVLVCAEDRYADLEDEYDGLPMGQLKKTARGPWDRPPSGRVRRERQPCPRSRACPRPPRAASRRGCGPCDRENRPRSARCGSRFPCA